MKNKIYISCDHAGYQLKEEIINTFKHKNYEIIDLGTNNGTDSVSYVDYGKKLAKNVLDDKKSYGIGICGTGLGISYCVNRYKGIRGARVSTVEDAKLARMHNDANIILLGGRQINIKQANEIIEMFLDTKYEGGRHQKRIESLDEIK